MAHDDFRDGVERDGFRQARAERVQPGGPRRERPIPSFALAQGGFGLLALSQLDVGLTAKRFGLSQRALGQRVPVCAGDRQCRTFHCARQQSILVAGGDMRMPEAERNRPDCPTRRDHRHGNGAFPSRQLRVDEEIRVRHAAAGR